MGKVHLQLSEVDRAHLQGLVRPQQVSVKVHRRATALLALDAGASLQAAGQAAAGANYNAVARWRDVCKEEGLAAVLRDRPRSGRPPRIDGVQRAKVSALACSTPPTGHARWSPCGFMSEETVFCLQHPAYGPRPLEPASARGQERGVRPGGGHLAPPRPGGA